MVELRTTMKLMTMMMKAQVQVLKKRKMFPNKILMNKIKMNLIVNLKKIYQKKKKIKKLQISSCIRGN